MSKFAYPEGTTGSKRPNLPPDPHTLGKQQSSSRSRAKYLRHPLYDANEQVNRVIFNNAQLSPDMAQPAFAINKALKIQVQRSIFLYVDALIRKAAGS
ncbi:MAG: hypothetical protein M1835_003504 [Candelina submexicana]|nr:MAG: hypothetical protein M1835_003504 [Candelina submexicana]